MKKVSLSAGNGKTIEAEVPSTLEEWEKLRRERNAKPLRRAKWLKKAPEKTSSTPSQK